jgi:hypothetical protein
METQITVQATAKRWKLLKAAGWVMLAGCVYLLGTDGDRMTAMLLLLAGGCCWFTGRVGAWWQNR